MLYFLDYFQKYSNLDKKNQIHTPSSLCRTTGTPGRNNLPGYLTDPHGTPNSVGLCISLCIINNITEQAHGRTCQYAHRHCYLCTIPHARKVASRSNSRPQGLYLSLAKLCKAFAGAEDFILLSGSNMSKMPPVRLLEFRDCGYLRK
mgnify:CR=1 FL=1